MGGDFTVEQLPYLQNRSHFIRVLRWLHEWILIEYLEHFPAHTKHCIYNCQIKLRELKVEGVNRHKSWGWFRESWRFRKAWLLLPILWQIGGLRPRGRKACVQGYKPIWHGTARMESLAAWLSVCCRAAGVGISMEKGDWSHGPLHRTANVVFRRGDPDVSSEER